MNTPKAKRYLTSLIKTKDQTTYNYRIKVKDRLSKIFTEIPSNAIINKGRCGIGGTYLEIKAKRNSIIIVPTNAIIDGKCFDSNMKLKTNYYDVRGKAKTFDSEALKAFMSSEVIGKKIFCTPESLSKIINCGVDIDLLYREWFVLLDESHSVITDSYREMIITVFPKFFKFLNKSMISATPYEFSDNRLKRFDVYNITFKGYVNRIKIMNTNNVESLLLAQLIDPNIYPGRVHVFLNSVTYIANIIRMSQLEDYSIFCKDDKKNMDKLDELRGNFKDFPHEQSLSKFNFYTSKYFEGWDLYDPNSTTIIVTDIKNATLKIGISNKCVQAAGRNRNHSNQIIHITNSLNIQKFIPFHQLSKTSISICEDTVARYNQHLSQMLIEGIPSDKNLKTVALKYADVSESKQAIINRFKIDQLVNAEFSYQQFNHLKYITEAWENAGFKCTPCDVYMPNLPSNVKALSKVNAIKVIVEFMEGMDNFQDHKSDYALSLVNKLPIETAEIISAYQELGVEKIRALGFQPKLIKEAVIEVENERNLQLVKNDFFEYFRNIPQLICDINPLLQSLYELYRIRNPKTGLTKSANAKTFMSIFKKVEPFRQDKLNGYQIVEY